MKNDIAIVLCFYNGKESIASQVDSIFNQDYKKFDLYIFDDASETPFNIRNLNLNASQIDRIKVFYRNENLGYAYNFLNGLKEINDNYKYYCFCDQDDIWLPNKLSNSIREISKFDHNKPCLYGSRTKLVNYNSTKDMGLSPLFKGPFNFKNALIQNFAGGNTMMMNFKAKELISTSYFYRDIVSHDWWCYQIISGAGGIIIYDKHPCLLYIQHEKNIVGSNKSILSKIKRLIKLLKGDYKQWNNINTKLLIKNEKLLNNKNKLILRKFINARNTNNIFSKMYIFFKIGIFRQSYTENIFLFIAFLLNKV